MDETPEDEERRLDEAFGKMTTSLAKEKAEFKQAGDEIQTRANAMLDYARKNIRDLEKPITTQEVFLSAQSAHALAQVFKLGERLTTELEFLYATNYWIQKNSIRIEKSLPDRVRMDTEKLIEQYQKSMKSGLMTEEDKAVMKFLWDWFVKHGGSDDTGKSG